MFSSFFTKQPVEEKSQTTTYADNIFNPSKLVEEPTYKSTDYYNFYYDANVSNSYTIPLNSRFPCSYVRFSLSAVIDSSNYTQMLSCRLSSFGIIGTLKNNYGYEAAGPISYFMDTSEPCCNGITYYQTNKIYVNGNYTLTITNLDGTAPDTTTSGPISITAEYFS